MKKMKKCRIDASNKRGNLNTKKGHFWPTICITSSSVSNRAVMKRG